MILEATREVLPTMRFGTPTPIPTMKPMVLPTFTPTPKALDPWDPWDKPVYWIVLFVIIIAVGTLAWFWFYAARHRQRR